MQQIALSATYPRSIAWLVRLDEWKRFEVIIKYNCAMIGGYFNIVVPLEGNGTISNKYQSLLTDYDPDLIVLAPNMTPDQIKKSLPHIHPFGIIPWEMVSAIAILDPLDGKNGINATTVDIWLQMKKEPTSFSNMFIATANIEQPDTSRLALVACGDVEPRKPLSEDEIISLDEEGYRESFLKRSLLAQNAQNYAYDRGLFINAPDRYQLTSMIPPNSIFPLSNATSILKACCRSQHSPDAYQSFIGLTTLYQRLTRTPSRKDISRGTRPPSIVILLSKDFGLKEAILFWNLRANRIYVAWLSFSELENNLEAVAHWLDSQEGGLHYWMFTGANIAFSVDQEDIIYLKTILGNLQNKRRQQIPYWNAVCHDELIDYNYNRPHILRDNVFIINNEDSYSFIPQIPQGNASVMYTSVLQWKGCMLPRIDSLVQKSISSEGVQGFAQIGKKLVHTELPKFRINSEHYLQVQISESGPIEFRRPSTENIIAEIFARAGFKKIERSSTARYHTIFINRAGGRLEDASYYLATSPYRELFELLTNHTDKSKPGWLLEHPSKRRTLHHLQLLQFLKEQIPESTQGYFNTISDQLPNEIVHLLEKGLLERGFYLSCTSCSFRSWYPVEHVGQTFQCARCSQDGVYTSNPLWLYKLPEVIFQGFNNDMQVPLLALTYLKHKSHHFFEWLPDLDIFLNQKDKKRHGNIDICCIADGMLFIGEAKNNGEIENDQFSFYEQLSQQVLVDGLVFATTETHWKRQTQQLIERLKTRFEGQVLVLTKADLYPDTPYSHQIRE